MEWLRRWWNTERWSRNEVLEMENRELRSALIDALKASQELNRKLVDSQDKVITSKFDAPLSPNPEPQPNNQSMFPPDSLGDALSLDDDAEFLERVHG